MLWPNSSPSLCGHPSRYAQFPLDSASHNGLLHSNHVSQKYAFPSTITKSMGFMSNLPISYIDCIITDKIEPAPATMPLIRFYLFVLALIQLEVLSFSPSNFVIDGLVLHTCMSASSCTVLMELSASMVKCSKNTWVGGMVDWGFRQGCDVH